MPFSLRWAAFFLTACFHCDLPHLSYTTVLKEVAMEQHIDAPVPAQQARTLYEGMALYGFDTDARIALIRRGIPASTISR